MVKTYARWGGIILLVLGVIGLFVGDQFLGVLNTENVEDIIHIVVGAILTWIGFRGTDAQARTWSYVFGVVFLLVGIVGFLDKSLYGLFPKVGLSAVDNIVHLIYGAVGLWAGYSYKG